MKHVTLKCYGHVNITAAFFNNFTNTLKTICNSEKSKHEFLDSIKTWYKFVRKINQTYVCVHLIACKNFACKQYEAVVVVKKPFLTVIFC